MCDKQILLSQKLILPFNPKTNIADPSFGQGSSTAAPRIIQLALHLKF